MHALLVMKRSILHRLREVCWRRLRRASINEKASCRIDGSWLLLE
jgi:hypothetical protein